MIVKRPPMGWNTWNTFGPDVNEQIVRESTDAFAELGLKDYGYEYIVIDDCWSKRQRDPETDRLVADPIKFPSGMKSVGDYHPFEGTQVRYVFLHRRAHLRRLSGQLRP